MGKTNPVEAYRLAGNYSAATDYFFKLSNEKRIPMLLDFAFIQFSRYQYNESLTFFLTYIQKMKPTKLNSMGQFLICELGYHFPHSSSLAVVKEFYGAFKAHEKVVKPFRIESIYVSIFPMTSYIFKGQCDHCDHEFEISTDVTLLVDFYGPCPCCFNSFSFNSAMIESFLESSKYTFPTINTASWSFTTSISPLIPKLLMSYNDFLVQLMVGGNFR
ncbi:MAG: hypothetical protein ACON35_00615 [Candidatus Marinamargulisbacteria bacterium]